MEISLDRVFEFTALLLRFQEVVRKVSVPGRSINENDAEHSYQLAMMAWYLNVAGELGLDTDRLIRYGLVHDLPETYAGDNHIFDVEGLIGKAEREAAAIERISAEFSDFPELVEAVHAYEQRDDQESEFIYALDKLMPMIVIYLEGGSTWRELDFSLDALMSNKAEKTAGSPLVSSLSHQLEVLIRAQPGLFNRA